MIENKKQINIQYKIFEIRKISHFENDYHDFNISEKEVAPGKFETNYAINFPGNDLIDFRVKVNFYSTKDIQNKLFGLDVIYKFKVRNLEQKFKIKEGYRIPDGLMHTIIEMTMSGVRGMLSVLNTIPIYKRIILQPVNAKEISLLLSPHNINQDNKKIN